MLSARVMILQDYSLTLTMTTEAGMVTWSIPLVHRLIFRLLIMKLILAYLYQKPARV